MASTIRRDLLAATVQTTNATPTTLVSVPIPTGAVVVIWALVAGRQAATDGMGFVNQGTYRNNGGTVSLVGANASALTNRDAPLTTATVTFVISGTNVNVTVTGVGGLTLEWGGFITILMDL